MVNEAPIKRDSNGSNGGYSEVILKIKYFQQIKNKTFYYDWYDIMMRFSLVNVSLYKEIKVLTIYWKIFYMHTCKKIRKKYK